MIGIGSFLYKATPARNQSRNARCANGLALFHYARIAPPQMQMPVNTAPERKSGHEKTQHNCPKRTVILK